MEEPETRVCKHCHQAYPPTSEFWPRASQAAGGLITPHGVFQSWCRECRKAYSRQRDQAKRDAGTPARKWRGYQEARALVDQIKVERGCADCGYRTHPAALDFDHLPGTEKHTTVANLIAFGQTAKIMAEIEKCEVVCANCHRIRTHERQRLGLSKVGRPRKATNFQKIKPS
jgi:hypothetical protein